jgi:hypothetical protein
MRSRNLLFTCDARIRRAARRTLVASLREMLAVER